MNYKYKQLKIEAVRLEKGNIDEVLDFLSGFDLRIIKVNNKLVCNIETTGGTLIANEEDYIVKCIDTKELGIYKPELFNVKFERA